MVIRLQGLVASVYAHVRFGSPKSNATRFCSSDLVAVSAALTEWEWAPRPDRTWWSTSLIHVNIGFRLEVVDGASAHSAT